MQWGNDMTKTTKCATTIIRQREAVKFIKRIRMLRTALKQLLYVIEIDELVPPSVSYMKQAREALEKTKEFKTKKEDN